MLSTSWFCFFHTPSSKWSIWEWEGYLLTPLSPHGETDSWIHKSTSSRFCQVTYPAVKYVLLLWVFPWPITFWGVSTMYVHTYTIYTYTTSGAIHIMGCEHTRLPLIYITTGLTYMLSRSWWQNLSLSWKKSVRSIVPIVLSIRLQDLF